MEPASIHIDLDFCPFVPKTCGRVLWSRSTSLPSLVSLLDSLLTTGANKQFYRLAYYQTYIHAGIVTILACIRGHRMRTHWMPVKSPASFAWQRHLNQYIVNNNNNNNNTPLSYLTLQTSNLKTQTFSSAILEVVFSLRWDFGDSFTANDTALVIPRKVRFLSASFLSESLSDLWESTPSLGWSVASKHTHTHTHTLDCHC